MDEVPWEGHLLEEHRSLKVTPFHLATGKGLPFQAEADAFRGEVELSLEELSKDPVMPLL